MLKLYVAVKIILVSVMFFSTDLASGQQNFPSRPIRILTAGGSGDFLARLVAQRTSGSLGQNVVDSRTTTISAEVVAKAPPDGYTLLWVGSALWLGPLLQKMSYDTLRDFSPITAATTSPLILVVHPSLPVKSVNELIALAKARPGQLNYASTGVGGISNLSAELFKFMTGVNMVRVNYKATANALTGLMGGEVQLMFSNILNVLPHMQSGKLRSLGVGSAQPTALAPGVPTIAASVPGYEAVQTSGVFAPAGTPVVIVNYLNREIVRTLNAADVKEQLLQDGAEVVGSSPEQLAATIKSDIGKMSIVIKNAGIRAD